MTSSLILPPSPAFEPLTLQAIEEGGEYPSKEKTDDHQINNHDEDNKDIKNYKIPSTISPKYSPKLSASNLNVNPSSPNLPPTSVTSSPLKVSVTSPTGLPQYKQLTGTNLAKVFWDNL